MTRSPGVDVAPPVTSSVPRLRVDLALQGGGSDGAFTWGVLDRLLQDPTPEFGGISGTSAGAMNAVAVAAGLMEGGREGARANLRRFWARVRRCDKTALFIAATCVRTGQLRVFRQDELTAELRQITLLRELADLGPHEACRRQRGSAGALRCRHQGQRQPGVS